MIDAPTLDMSFSGLKTAVRTLVHRLSREGHFDDAARADVARAFEDAIVDVLARKAVAALDRTGLDRLVVAGGVGANASLRARLHEACAKQGARVHHPEPALCTDNGAMIALAAAMRLQRGRLGRPQGQGFEVLPRWPLEAA
jgi:N6-L-threonylcarbamoyladenine synthase